MRLETSNSASKVDGFNRQDGRVNKFITLASEQFPGLGAEYISVIPRKFILKSLATIENRRSRLRYIAA
jgi:hypothetical protein